MSRNNGITKNKRTNKHSSSIRARRSASDLRDQELLASAWRELRNKPRADRSGCFRAMYPGECPRCERRPGGGAGVPRPGKLGASWSDGYIIGHIIDFGLCRSRVEIGQVVLVGDGDVGEHLVG